ncbi:MAG TPA: glycosyltransferase, partial [Accumulibacter sp.]|nr:glycosyltransferase [Accumulibacter sp.]
AGRTGELVPANDPESMARQIVAYALNPETARAAGRAGREAVERRFSLAAMTHSYRALYDRLRVA